VSDRLPALRSALLDAVPGVAHGFFGRRGGVSAGPFASLNTGEAVDDDPARVEENRARVARAIGVEPSALVALRQIHSARVLEIAAGELTAARGAKADALLTVAPELGLAVKTADCVPMLVSSADGAVVSAVHAGWRGLAGGMIAAVAAAFAARGVDPAELRVAIGPHIGPCCYEVGAEVITALGAESEVARGDRSHADLGAVASARWRAAGVSAAAIDRLGPCVACDAAGYFSHRRDRGVTGRQLAAITRLG